MSKKKLLFNSFISLIIVFFCLFIFINNSKEGIQLDILFQYIYNGWLHLTLASILLILSVYFRALRWKYLFQSNKFQSISDLFSAQLVGYFINNISPIRIGDFAKSYLVSKKTDQKNSYILGSIMMERVLDTIMLLIFMSIIISSYGLEYLNINFSLLSIYNIIPIILLSFFSIYCIKFFIPCKIQNILSEFLKGFTAINLSNKSAVIFSSIFIWLIYWINVFLIQLIFPSFELTLIECLFILVASSFIQMIPTGFGGLGIFHLGVNTVMIKLGIINYEYFLILLWLYSYFIYTILGSYYFIQNGKFTIKNLYHDLIKNQ